MTRKSKWLLVAGLATILTSSTVFMAAQAAERQQEGGKGGRPGFAAKCDFMKKGPRGMFAKEDHAKLLEVLKVDAETFKSERQAGKSMLTIAQEHGVSEQTLVDFMVKQGQQRLEKGVSDGRITAEKAAELKGNMEQRVAKMIRHEGSMGPKGPMGLHGKRGMPELLALLKIDGPTLHNELKQGKSLIVIAAEKGVSEQELKDTLLKADIARIDKGVAAGRIPADKAEEMKAKAPERLEKFLSGAKMGEHKHRGGKMKPF